MQVTPPTYTSYLFFYLLPIAPGGGPSSLVAESNYIKSGCRDVLFVRPVLPPVLALKEVAVVRVD